MILVTALCAVPGYGLLASESEDRWLGTSPTDYILERIPWQPLPPKLVKVERISESVFPPER